MRNEKPILDRDAPLPLYRQVEEWLRNQIDGGTWMSGAILPSVKALCQQLGGINQLTVRQAMNKLILEGRLYAIQGRGTFVSGKTVKPLRIALVLPNLDDEFTRAIAHGVREVLDSERLSEEGGSTRPKAITVILDSYRNAQKEEDNIRSLEDMPLDGAIIFPLIFGEMAEHLVRLKGDRFPFVLVDAGISELGFNSVRADHYKGGYMAARHLLETGRRRLAWIGNRSGYYSCRERFDGYRDAINDFGLACDRTLAVDLKTESPTSPFGEAMERAMDQILAAPVRPDGILCSNDLEALACLEILKRRGVLVPREIAVAGFDDQSEAAKANPPLTTVRQPAKEIGRQAAELILERIGNPSPRHREILLPVELIVRESSASPERKNESL